VALIRDAQPAVSNEIEIEYAMPIHAPMVDVRTVGAGGDPIARINAAGLPEVGPHSAGADRPWQGVPPAHHIRREPYPEPSGPGQTGNQRHGYLG
jgi:hypothetical protein